MISHRCKNCIWFDNRERFTKFLPKIEWAPNPGFCRRRKSAAIRIERAFVGVHPVHDAEEFCGEFKSDKQEDN